MVTPFLALFPILAKGGFRVTSPIDEFYNCIAFAAGDHSQWWWPFPNDKAFWPAGVDRVETIEAFRDAFASIGFAICDDEDLQVGYEKVAIFAIDSFPTHAARQKPDGRWSSKIGELEDIEHDLRDLEGDEYGTVRLLMKRPVE